MVFGADDHTGSGPGNSFMARVENKDRFVALAVINVILYFFDQLCFIQWKNKGLRLFCDCIPLTPIQTFAKDIILLILVLLILFKRKYIKPLFANALNTFIFFLSLVAVLALQWYVLKHLPVKDCLPFKTGNNILELRKMPKDAVPDKYDYVFVYKKNGVSKEFKVNALPDSSWEFAERKQVLIEKGKNNIPKINDFILATASGIDSTETILSQPGEYYLLFVKDISLFANDWPEDQRIVLEAAERGKKIFIVASQRKNAEELYGSLTLSGNKLDIPVLTCDATALKTAARNNITLYQMNGPVVKNKWGGVDIEKALKD